MSIFLSFQDIALALHKNIIRLAQSMPTPTDISQGRGELVALVLALAPSLPPSLLLLALPLPLPLSAKSNELALLSPAVVVEQTAEELVVVDPWLSVLDVVFVAQAP